MYLNITLGLVLKHKIVVCIASAITKTVEICAAAAETLVTVS